MSELVLKLMAVMGVGVALVSSAGQALAEVKPGGVFGSGMVIQRDEPIPVWGTASPGEAVTVQFAGRVATVEADQHGKWRVTLDSISEVGPHALIIQGTNRVEFTDVLMGDVWLCSGQSNMAATLGAFHGHYKSEIASANFPMIRQGFVARNPVVTPGDDVGVAWTVCTPETAGGFTAVGYFFAKMVHQQTGVPIGIIHSSWGGTSAESWTSRAALESVPAFKQRLDTQMADLLAQPQRIEAFPAGILAWEQRFNRTDPGNAGEAAGWAAPDLDETGWTLTRLKTKWSDAGVPNGGIVWLRKEIDVPEASAGKPFRLDWGNVEEMYETTYFNGVKLGESGRKPPQFYSRYIGYNVPGELVKPGRNVIAIRLLSYSGGRTLLARNGDGIGLAALGITQPGDEVLMKVETEFSPITQAELDERPVYPRGSKHNVASTLYNGMIHSLAPIGLKGVVWYQGEQDAGRAFAYRTLLPMMIDSWRSLWAKPALPFVILQLPNWRADGAERTGWAELREAQWLTSQSVDSVYIACSIDVGESADVHPRNKEDPGKRLALVALAKVYGQDVVYSGPRYESMSVEGSRVTIRMSHAEGMTTRDGGAVGAFTIAGADKKFVPAQVVIEGETLIVHSDEVPEPAAVRYAYVNDPVNANLVGKTGLPAFPFRTDTWPASTDDRK